MCCNAIQSTIQLDSIDMQMMLQFDHSLGLYSMSVSVSVPDSDWDIDSLVD